MIYENFISMYESAFKEFFLKESKILKDNPDVFEFSVRYTAFRLGLSSHASLIDSEKSIDLNPNDFKLSDNGIIVDTESDFGDRLHKRFELPELVFFGLRDKVKPNHHFLTNRQAFWGIFGSLFTYIEYPSFMSNEIKQACLTQERLEIDLSERNKCYALFQITSKLFVTNMNLYINDSKRRKGRPVLSAVAEDMICNRIGCMHEGKLVSLRKFCKTVSRVYYEKGNQTLKSVFNNIDTAYVYRGFDIHKNDSVRLNRLKLNNPYAHIQQNGVGFSYSPNNEVCTLFAMSKFKDTLTLSNNERVNNKSSIKFDLLDINSIEFLNTEYKIPVIGKYLINKKDILFTNLFNPSTTDQFHSNEIVLFPENVKLLDYRILNRNSNVKILDKVA